jgi:pimeloyl-ACP methyl ester carboxylesterase
MYRLLLGFILLMLAGCLPLPQVYLDPEMSPVVYRQAPANIQTQYVSLPGYPEPHTPVAYNKALYLRYYLPEDSAQTILVIEPGIFGGATSVDILARQLVAAIPNLEVWAVDRRANLLEDRSAIRASLWERDPMLAYNYYIRDLATPQGFNLFPPDDVRFMAEWSLEVHLYDLHEIVKQAHLQASQVILGGHSLGGSMVSYYAAFDFSEGPGYTHLDGLVLLDGVLGRTGGFDREPQGLNLGPIELIPGTEGLKDNRGSPYFTFGITPEFYARREVAALLAYFDPTGLSPGGWVDFPATNLAVVGIREDDQYGSSTVFSSSVGEVVGATFAGNLTAVILGGSEGIYSQTVTGVAKGYDFVDWSRGDPSDEHADLSQVVKAWATPDTNRSEWYFPIRLAIDIGQYDVRLENTLGFIPNRLVTTPTLAVGAGRGLVTNLESFSAYSNARIGSAFSSYVIPDFTHLDIVQAEFNPVVGFFQRWLEQLPE